MIRIATYGTFRKGEVRERFMDELRESGRSKEMTLNGVKMLDLGPYPGAVFTDDENDEIVVELLEAEFSKKKEEDLLKQFDAIEGVAFGLYDRNSIRTPWGKAVIYTICDPDRYEDAPVIRDWKDRKALPNCMKKGK